VSNSINYFSGPEDHRTLSTFIRSLGFMLFTVRIEDDHDVDLDDFSESPGCYISNIPKEGLKKNRVFPDFISGSNDDPIITWGRSYIKDRWIVSGSFRYLLDSDRPDWKNMAKVYRKIQRWIKNNWKKEDGTGFYFGPEAWDMTQNKGFSAVSFIPGTVKLTQIVLDDDGNEIERKSLDDISEFEDR
jgi:hypothetical protein